MDLPGIEHAHPSKSPIMCFVRIKITSRTIRNSVALIIKIPAQRLDHLLESNILSSLPCHHIIICGKLALIMSSLYMAVSTWFPRNLRQARAHHVVFVYGCEHVVSSKFAASSRSSCCLCLWLWAYGFLEICGKLALIMSSLYMAVSTWFPRNLRQSRAHHVLFVYGCEHVVSSRLIICYLSGPEDG